MEDYENDEMPYENPEELNPNDKIKYYDTPYLKTIKDLSASFDGDEVDEIIGEMESLRYNPSNKPRLDAEINFLKAQNMVRAKSRFDSHTESLLRDKAERTGKPLAQVKREARAYLKGGK